jgi:nucleotidyltransferase AbiEii toxin of type IV toxin-antitoxin system
METGGEPGHRRAALVQAEMSAFPYKTASAFRTALKAKLAAVANADKTFSVDELQRQFAFDRALARCFTADDGDLWVLKGAGALLARIDTARHSKDIDLFYAQQSADAGEAVAALEMALARDIGDYFRFQVTRVEYLMEPASGRRVHLTCMLGPKPFTSYHIDVVVGTAMSGTPEPAPPLTALRIDGLVRPDYRVFPLVDHLADKLYAMISTHDQQGRLNVSSRIKDLVDVALITRTHRISGPELRQAILVGSAHRAVPLPDHFEIPDPTTWRTGYPQPASQAPGQVPDYDEAVDLAKRLLDPPLAGPVTGEWDPQKTDWLS